MKNRGEGRWRLAGGLTALAALLAGVTLVIFLVAGDGDTMARGMRAYTRPEYTGIPEDRLAEVAAHLTDYITGRKESFQLVMTPEGRGVVTDSNILTGKLKVRLDKNPDSPAVDMHRDDVSAVIRGNKPREEAAQPAPEAEVAAEPAPPVQPKPQKPAEKPQKSAEKPAQTGRPAEKGGKPDHRPRRHSPRNKRQG